MGAMLIFLQARPPSPNNITLPATSLLCYTYVQVCFHHLLGNWVHLVPHSFEGVHCQHLALRARAVQCTVQGPQVLWYKNMNMVPAEEGREGSQELVDGGKNGDTCTNQEISAQEGQRWAIATDNGMQQAPVGR